VLRWSVDDITVEIATVQGPVEAELVRGILESNGIAVVTATRVPHSVWPFTVDGLGEVRIRVSVADADRARDLLGHHRQAGLVLIDSDGEPRAEPPPAEDPPSSTDADE